MKQKSYDVKTFLNKKKTCPSFVTFSFKGRVIKTFFLIFSFGFFIYVAFGMFLQGFATDDATQRAVENTITFFHADSKRKKLNIENMFCMNASALMNFKNTKNTQKQNAEKESKPKVNIEKQTVYTNGVEIKNETDYDIDTISLLGEELKGFSKSPKVLIVHTHGSESYTPSKKYSYTHTGNYRTQNTKFNMISVGEKLALALKSKGIEVIHDKTINDYPSYNDSYNKTEKIIKNYLQKDPDIAFVFDIHRDAIGTDSKIVKFVSNVDGKSVAQVMMVCGTDTNLQNPNWRENVKLAVNIQNYFNVEFPGFLRPLNIRKERFNMHLTTGSLLFEVGTNGNTMEEALRSAEVLGEGIGDYINSNLKINVPKT